MTMRSLALIPLAIAAACAQAAKPLPMRLPADVKPLAESVELRIDPDSQRFSGSVRIEVQTSKPLRELRLHARKLTVSGVEAQAANGAKQTGKATVADIDSIRLQFKKPLPAGKTVLLMKFTGRTEEAEPFGLFRLKDGGHHYVYTQFEDIASRRAFPSFDEPGNKLPWTLTLVVPAGQRAFSNMPVEQQSTEKAGWQRLRFATTPPLPSYLVAFAVGPIEVVEGPPAGGRTPLRYLVPQGHADEVSYARASTPAIVVALEDYFGTRHPFPKLDSVAMPLPANSFGAMEHPGLITYESNLILAPKVGARANFETDYVSTAAHEIAHQWVGNLVTMAWWNDLWLNESFAPWMGDKITAQIHPEWHWELHAAADARRQALAADGLPKARRVRQPVETNEDLGTAFNAITYQKGQTVLSMFEGWLGEDRMREGVRRYIARHARGNARAEDLFAALAEQDRPEHGAALAASIASYVEQPGLPLVQFKLDCSAAQPAVELQQQRYAQQGAKTAPMRWSVPIVMRTPAGETRVLLAAESQRVALPDAACPAWLQPDATSLGYYVAELPASGVQALLASGTMNEPRALLRLLEDRLALARAGRAPISEALALMDRMAAHPQLAVRGSALQALVDLQPLLKDADKPGYAALVQRLFGAQAREIGWQATAKEEPQEVTAWRAQLLPQVAVAGQDAELRAQALVMVAKDPNPSLLAVVAPDGDEALFDALLASARGTEDRVKRGNLLKALTMFRAPALRARALALALDRKIDAHEILPDLLAQHGDTPESLAALLKFLKRNEAVLAKQFGGFERSSWPKHVAEHACGAQAASALQAHFGPGVAKIEGGAAVLADSVEQLQLCGAWRDAQADALTSYLNVNLSGEPDRKQSTKLK